MLPQSRKPEIIRLHNLQQSQRSRFTSQFVTAMTEMMPNLLNKTFLSHPIFQNIVPDIYFTYVTICLSRRRLGEQYTYVTMYKQKHYEEQGVLVTKKYRLLVFVLQIISRNLIPTLLNRIFTKFTQFFKKGFISAVLRQVGNSNQILNNFQWFLMMLFMLNITKSPNLIDNSLGISYIYTIFNQNQQKINYKIEGFLLAIIFIVKIAKSIYNISNTLSLTDRSKASKKAISSLPQDNLQRQKSNVQSGNQEEICRICYSEISQKSCTKCGHVFCWDCIIQSLDINSECPVCRTTCLPREVIQMQNF